MISRMGKRKVPCEEITQIYLFLELDSNSLFNKTSWERSLWQVANYYELQSITKDPIMEPIKSIKIAND